LQVAALRSTRCGAGQIATLATRQARSRAAEYWVQSSARSGHPADMALESLPVIER